MSDDNEQNEPNASSDSENESQSEGELVEMDPPVARVYPNMDDALNACHEHSKNHGYELVRRKPINNKNKQLCRVWLECKRHRKLSNTRKLKDNQRQRPRSSMRTGCPMRIILAAVSRPNPDGPWEVRYHGREKMHNHPPDNILALAGHRRRTRNDYIRYLIAAQDAAGIKVGQTLKYINQQHPEALVTRQDVENERQKMRIELQKMKEQIEAQEDDEPTPPPSKAKKTPTSTAKKSTPAKTPTTKRTAPATASSGAPQTNAEQQTPYPEQQTPYPQPSTAAHEQTVASARAAQTTAAHSLLSRQTGPEQFMPHASSSQPPYMLPPPPSTQPQYWPGPSQSEVELYGSGFRPGQGYGWAGS